MRDFHIGNRSRLASRLPRKSFALVLSGKAPRATADEFYPFKPDRNFYYLTGLKRENFFVLLVKDESEVEEMLFIEEPQPDIEKWVGRRMTRDEAVAVSGIPVVFYERELKTILNKVIHEKALKTAFFDLERLTFEEPQNQIHSLVSEFREKYPHIQIESLHYPLRDLRVKKQGIELEQIRGAVALTRLGIDEILRNLRPGLYEYQMEALFNYVIMNNGAEGNAFKTIVASGPNGVILHYVENQRRMKKNELVLLDLGARFEGYNADVSRTFPVGGTFTPRQRELYELVLKVQEEVLQIMKKGTLFSELNLKAVEVFTRELLATGLIEKPEEVSKYYYHGVGHYLGLDTHDIGARDIPLEPGMVITLEPGVYVSEEAIGIRIEDDILITEEGPVVLTRDIPKEIHEIEAIMKNQ
ncbi:MAG: hypothetical protein AVO33_08945 [delta proteobacterium ML8_F1]|nr:MAG: hypothetical protein AVO33_08945 [delta proteobacterium ML8_F1]